MTIPERIALIKNLEAELGKLGWRDAEWLMEDYGVLSQPFGGQYGEEYSDWMRGELRSADNSNLFQLAEHFGIAIPAGTIVPPHVSLPWTDGFLRVFISHHHSDKRMATSIKLGLAQYGLSCFVAHEDITPSREWLATIEASLSTCDVCIAVIGNEFHKSEWTDQEVGWCVGRGVPVVPVCIPDNMPYGFVSKFQALFSAKYNESQLDNEIFTVMTTESRLNARLDHALIMAFATAYSFGVGDNTAKRLYYVKEWNDSFREKVAAAIASNNQILNRAATIARKHAGLPEPPPKLPNVSARR